jgi:UDP-2,3-diacylglucosamine hydrolase
MSTLFISDLHLSADAPRLTHLFLNFLQHSARDAEALYILGDLFESWIGDDDETPFHQQIATALAELTANGVKTYFMPGNRDFLLGERFIEKTGCIPLADPTLISLYGIPTLLTHGDSLCTLDKKYLTFRRLTRMRFLQSLFLKLPLSLRKKIACYLRGTPHPTIPSTLAKYDVVMSAVMHCLTLSSAQLIIHGHTHQPCIQLFQQKDKVNHTPRFLKRYVLSDWNNNQGNVLKFSSNGDGKLCYFSCEGHYP